MKRCNNCGWFNVDSAISCDKCGEESFELEEVIVEEDSISTTNGVESQVVDVPKPVEEGVTPRNKFAMATVAISSDAPVVPDRVVEQKSEPSEDVKPMAKFAKSTIAIDSEVPSVRSAISSLFAKKQENSVAEASVNQPQPSGPISCPKCCYPITGYVEYCPNCGATIKKAPMCDVPCEATTNADVANTVFEASPNLKDTIGESLLDDAEKDVVYRLIPMDILSEAVIELRLGDVVVIRGERFKFDK